MPKPSPTPMPGYIKELHKTHKVFGWIDHHQALVAGMLVAVFLVFLAVDRIVTVLRRNRLGKTAAARNLAQKIGPRIGWKPPVKDKNGKRKTAEKFVSWPRGDIQATGVPITIRYPAHFSALDKEIAFIPEVINSLVGGEWDLTHDALHHRLKYTRRAVPRTLPEKVTYHDDPLAPVDLIPFAKNDRDEWIRADLTHLTPHVLVSASTGWGKTSSLSLFIAHTAARGALIDICDPKQIGYNHFEGLPMIRISTEIETMIDTIELFRSEMEEAYRAMKAGTANPDRPLRVLVLDELGSFADMCVDHHQAGSGRGVPPVFRSMKRILWQGRAAGFHVISAAQQANVKALFGVSDARDQYALRIAAGPQSSEAWSMLFGRREETSRPGVDPVKGRAIVGVSSEFAIAQLAQITSAKAREVAARGRARFADVVSSVVPDVVNVVRPSVVSVVKMPVEPGAGTIPAFETTPNTTLPDLHLVPEVFDKPRVQSPTRGGRRAGRESVLLDCAACGRQWGTTAAEGSSVKCPNCSRARRVPTGSRSRSTSPER